GELAEVRLLRERPAVRHLRGADAALCSHHARRPALVAGRVGVLDIRQGWQAGRAAEPDWLLRSGPAATGRRGELSRALGGVRMSGLPWWRWINPWLYMQRRD